MEGPRSSERPVVSAKTLRIFVAAKSRAQRSRMEDNLVLDGFDVRAFASAASLWEAFQQSPVRMVITERRFGEGLDGLQLAGQIRRQFPHPYVYVVMLSAMNRVKEIREGLAAGVDDYVIAPPNPRQIRSSVLVGMRWLQYIDSLHSGGKSEP